MVSRLRPDTARIIVRATVSRLPKELVDLADAGKGSLVVSEIKETVYPAKNLPRKVQS